MIEDIFSPDSKLYNFLKKWTDTSGIKWKSNGEKSYLKSILTNRKYQVISPLYITSIYCEYIKKYENNYDKFNGIFEKHLNNIIINFKNECKKFKKQYNEIVDSYVYEHPLTNDPSYVLGFINSVILAILIFAEKLIELNIYAIHPIVVQLIEYYTPLDEINQYDPSENHGKKLCII